METLFYRIFWIDSDYFIARYYFLIIALFTFFCLLVCMSNVKTPLDSHFLKQTGEAILLQQHLMDGTHYRFILYRADYKLFINFGINRIRPSPAFQYSRHPLHTVYSVKFSKLYLPYLQYAEKL